MMTSRMMKKKVFRQGGPMWMFPFGLLFVLWSIPYNQSLVALFKQGGVGVVGLEARQRLSWDSSKQAC